MYYETLGLSLKLIIKITQKLYSEEEIVGMLAV